MRLNESRYQVKEEAYLYAEADRQRVDEWPVFGELLDGEIPSGHQRQPPR